MSAQSPWRVRGEVKYTDSGGRPMSDNTLQFQWITMIVGNLQARFRLAAEFRAHGIGPEA